MCIRDRRLGVRAAQDVRALNPDAHICFYGLYAWLNADYLLAHVGQHRLGRDDEEAPAIDGYDRAVATGVEAAAAGFDIAGQTGHAAVHIAGISL